MCWAYNLHIIKFIYFTSVVFNKPDPVVLPVAAVAVLKYPQRRAVLGEKCLISVHSPSLQTSIARESQGQGPQTAGTPGSRHIHSQGQRETNAFMVTCLFACCSALSSSSYTVQEPMPREWCCPQWAGSSQSNYLNLPWQPHSLTHTCPQSTHGGGSPWLRLFPGSRLVMLIKPAYHSC